MADQLIRETEAPLGVPPSPVPQVWDPTSNSYVKLYGSGNAMNTNATIIKEAGLYTVHHNAATAPATGAIANVTGYNTAVVQISGSFDYARVACKGSVDGTNFFTIPMISINGYYIYPYQWVRPGVYYCYIAGCSKFYVELLSFSGTSITIVSRAVTLTDTSFPNKVKKATALLFNNQVIPANSYVGLGPFSVGSAEKASFFIWSTTTWSGRLIVFGDYFAYAFLNNYASKTLIDTSFSVSNTLYKVSLTDIYSSVFITVYLYNLSSTEQSAYMSIVWI